MWVGSWFRPFWAVVGGGSAGWGVVVCRWPSIAEWEMYITAQDRRLRNDLYYVEWDVKLYYTIPY